MSKFLNFQEVRKYPRRAVAAPVATFGLHRHGIAKPIPFESFDVSEQGLGIVTDDSLLVSEDVLYLVSSGRTIKLRLCWCQPLRVAGGALTYRYGLECQDAAVNLEVFFDSSIFEESFCAVILSDKSMSNKHGNNLIVYN